MKYCVKCERQTPTKKVGDKEECMVCGAEIVNGGKDIKSTNVQSSNAKKMYKTYEKSRRNKEETGSGFGFFLGCLILLFGIIVIFFKEDILSLFSWMSDNILIVIIIFFWLFVIIIFFWLFVILPMMKRV